MPWSLVLTDLRGNSIGEIVNAYDRHLVFTLNAMPTLLARVRLDNPLADTLAQADCLVKAYDANVLRFVGEVISAEEDSADQGGSLAMSCAGPFWRLAKRLCGKSATGVTFTSQDRGAIAQSLITTANTEGDTGVRIGTIGTSSVTTTGPWYYKKVAEAITELSTAYDGFDFEIAPTEPTADATGVQIGTFNCAAILGQDRPEAIFEYGTGRNNCKSYRRQVSKDGLMNRGYNLPPGFPDNAADATVVTTSDAQSIADRGLFEDLVQADLVTQTFRQKLVDEHIGIRKVARQVITFEPNVNAPQFGTDYDLGDTLVARAVSAGTVRFNAMFRVYGVDIALDNEGKATVSPVLVPS